MLHKVKFRFAMIFAFLLLSGSIFAQSARLQVIHNSADVAAAEVDIYLWNTAIDQLVVKLDDFAFRAATPFVDVPAGEALRGAAQVVPVCSALCYSSEAEHRVLVRNPLDR